VLSDSFLAPLFDARRPERIGQTVHQGYQHISLGSALTERFQALLSRSADSMEQVGSEDIKLRDLPVADPYRNVLIQGPQRRVHVLGTNPACPVIQAIVSIGQLPAPAQQLRPSLDRLVNGARLQFMKWIVVNEGAHGPGGSHALARQF